MLKKMLQGVVCYYIFWNNRKVYCIKRGGEGEREPSNKKITTATTTTAAAVAATFVTFVNAPSG